VTDQPKSAGSNLPGAADAARVASELRALKKPTDDKA
jgi:hypothetical protein